MQIEKMSKAGTRRAGVDDKKSQAIDSADDEADILEDDSDYENEDEED